MRITACVAVLLTSSCLSAATIGFDDSEYSTIKGWAVHGFSDGKEIGYEWCETRSEAEKEKKLMEQIETTTGKYYDKVEIKPEDRRVLKNIKKETGKLDKVKEILGTIKEAKEAVDKAKEIDKEGFGALLKTKERKFGDTIKEYKKLLKTSFDQATEVKKTMVIGVQNASDAKFKEVNNLIDKYNRELVGFQSVMGPNYKTGFAPIIRLQKSSTKEAMSNEAPVIDETAKIYFAESKQLYRDGSSVKKEDDGWFRHGFGYDRDRKQPLPGTINQARDLIKQMKSSDFVKNNPELNQFRIVDKDGKVIE